MGKYKPWNAAWTHWPTGGPLQWAGGHFERDRGVVTMCSDVLSRLKKDCQKPDYYIYDIYILERHSNGPD